MDAILQWLPAIIAAATAVWTVATLSANHRAMADALAIFREANDKRHDSHEAIYRDHDTRLRAAEIAIVGLQVFDELQARRVRKEKEAEAE